MYNKKNCFIVLFLVLISATFISCDLFIQGGSNSFSQTVDSDDLEAILYTLAVLDQNHYADFTKFENDSNYSVKNTNPLYADYYDIREQIGEFEDKVIYERATIYNDAINLKFNDWSCVDFLRNSSFPLEPMISISSFFDDNEVIISNQVKIEIPLSGVSTVRNKDVNNPLKVKVNGKTYKIIFSYNYSFVSDTATAILQIDDELYSEELKEFIESIYSPD